ncbi:MAG: NAD-dependent epimerase/dehydratase family protein [Planctomycetaceae bacterium]|nr:NAD-dependent epimerase/dehydratase family protein [Planctomycetaceae bacterium]
MKHAVVTGANGLVGRRVVARLLERNVRTTAVDRVDGAFDCPFFNADLTQPEVLDEILTPETVVIHLAAKTSVAGSVEMPRQDFDVNVLGTLEVLESVRRRRASLVFSSSSAVFDPRAPLPHNEESPKKPSSPYGAGKLACEGYCHVYHHCYGLDVRIVRLFNAYGPGMSQYAIYDFFHKIRSADESIDILGDGRQVRDFLYVDDAAAGFLAVADSGAPGGDYNLASGRPTEILEVARTMARLMGRPDLVLRTTGQSFAGDVSQWYADITKLRGIGFTPRVSLEEGLSATINWLERQS